MPIFSRIHRASGSLLCCLAIAASSVFGGFVSGCTPSPTVDAPARRSPVLLIGVDGLEWKLVIELFHQGKLPNLARLAESGSFGELQTMHPSLSPTVWASVATGMRPAEHGIRGFIKSRTGGQELFTNRDRRTKALWNMASDNGRSSAVIGWWTTFPVEPVRGVMVAQVNNSVDGRSENGGVLKGGIVANIPHQVHPEELSEKVLGTAASVDRDLDPLLATIFKRPLPSGEGLPARLWAESAWSLRADLAYERIALDVLKQNQNFDLFMVYFGGTDVLAHRFWRWAYPDDYRFPPDEAEVGEYGCIVSDYYEYMDGVIGRLVAAAPADSVVLVMSDHGMDSANRKKLFEGESHGRPMRSGSHGPSNALFVLAGPGVRHLPSPRPMKDLRLEDVTLRGSIFDVAPTVLELLGLPIGADMPGKVLVKEIAPAFLAAHPPQTIPTHTPTGWFEGRLLPEVETPDSNERLQQLRSLGYIQ